MDCTDTFWIGAWVWYHVHFLAVIELLGRCLFDGTFSFYVLCAYPFHLSYVGLMLTEITTVRRISDSSKHHPSITLRCHLPTFRNVHVQWYAYQLGLYSLGMRCRYPCTRSGVVLFFGCENQGEKQLCAVSEAYASGRK